MDDHRFDDEARPLADTQADALDESLHRFSMKVHLRHAEKSLEQNKTDLNLRGDGEDITRLYAFDKIAATLPPERADLQENVRHKIDHALTHGPVKEKWQAEPTGYTPKGTDHVFTTRHTAQQGGQTFFMVPQKAMPDAHPRRLYTAEEFEDYFDYTPDYN